MTCRDLPRNTRGALYDGVRLQTSPAAHRPGEREVPPAAIAVRDLRRIAGHRLARGRDGRVAQGKNGGQQLVVQLIRPPWRYLAMEKRTLVLADQTWCFLTKAQSISMPKPGRSFK
jgi:hypothetical protein